MNEPVVNTQLKRLRKENPGLYKAAREWISDGWGLERDPTPEQIAAALLMEANSQPYGFAGELRTWAYAILDCAHKPLWTFEDTLATYRYGWGLFYLDDGTYQIQKLDDPEGVCEEHNLGRPKRTFKSDATAVRWVREQAKSGLDICVKALTFLAAQKNRVA